MKKAFIQLHVAVFLAGFTAVFGKLIELNEGLIVWYRLLITVAVLAVIMLIKKQLKPIPFTDMLRITGVGLILAIHWVCFYGSVKYANISVSLICLSATGFFTALLEPLIIKRKIVLAEILLGILAIGGIYVIFDFHPQYKTGIIFGMISALCAAIFPIFNKRLLIKYSPRVLTLYELGGGFLALSVLLPLYLTQSQPAYYLPTVTDWAWLLVLAVVCTVIGFDLQLNALKKIPPFTINLTYNLEPVYGIVLAFLFFAESKMFHNQFFIGLALIMLSIVLEMLRVLKTARASRKLSGVSQQQMP